MERIGQVAPWCCWTPGCPLKHVKNLVRWDKKKLPLILFSFFFVFFTYIILTYITCIIGISLLCCGSLISIPGLFTSLGLCGFFGASIGPILAEATCIVAGTKQYNIAFGWLMLATGIGMLVGPPIGGMHHGRVVPYFIICKLANFANWATELTPNAIPFCILLIHVIQAMTHKHNNIWLLHWYFVIILLFL